ncbi:MULTISPECIES: sporulation histidine kinase inhibitor Sda [unclassified Paenibacillus]
MEQMKERVRPMTLLNDDMLVETYQKAVELKLDREFISLLLEEIHRRNLSLPISRGEYAEPQQNY